MMKDAQRGLALMLVIWVLAIFMVVALSFSYATRTEISATLAFKEQSEERLLAESCMERALAEIMLGRNRAVPLDEDARAWKRDGSPYQIDFEQNGICRVMIMPESGRIDINKAPDTIIRSLLTVLGVPAEETDIIVDSLEDWRDPDSLVRLNGAENEYYLSLPVPYKARNGDFESIEELLLVRGMTTEIFYGNGVRPGLADFITVYSENGRINMNVASREVLMALPGMTAEYADAVIALRNAKQSLSQQDLQGLLGNLFLTMAPFIGEGTSNIFALEALGQKNIRKAGYAVKAIVSFADTKPVYLYYRSPWETGTWKQARLSKR